MEKIKNPFIGRENYNCFGCSPNNENGLRMEFWEDGEDIVSKWQPKNFLVGFENVLHGGVQATLMDEIAAWIVLVKIGVGGFTSKLEIKYKKPVLISRGEITLRASLVEMRRNLAYINVKINDAEDNLCAEGKLIFFTIKKETFQKKLDKELS